MNILRGQKVILVSKIMEILIIPTNQSLCYFVHLWFRFRLDYATAQRVKSTTGQCMGIQRQVLGGQRVGGNDSHGRRILRT